MTTEPLRFGLIGVDSSHAPSFTRLLGDGVHGAVPGARIAAAWQGPTVSDFPPSRDRNDQFASDLARLGVPFLDDPEGVADICDALLIVSSDQRTHPELLRQVAPAGRPVYIDTRFAATTSEAVDMLALAREYGTLMLAGSPKRFASEFRTALGRLDGPAMRIELDGALPTMPHHPLLAWYGVHLVDLAVAALGPGCTTVDATGDTTVLGWADGRSATLSGSSVWHAHTRGTINGHARAAAFDIEARPAMLHGLLESIVNACRTGVPNVPSAEVLTTVSIVEAAYRSRQSGCAVAPTH
ncbi:MAG: gfo/Idh/MocA family oxidoreductase [Microbacterium sp.]|jgi:predicted dehydrogenase|nr:gfo/Idh/MocA family oxidoreductase [Microbacterium sp.]